MTPSAFILRSVNLIDVEDRIIRKADIRVSGGRFTSIVDAGGRTPRGIKVIDCAGSFAAPGLIDAHTHTELSLMSVAPFAEMLLKSGTTAAIIDPHDFVNVVGMRGLRLLIREAVGTPLRVFFMAPSCVPSTTGLEDCGVKATVADVKAALRRSRVLGLAEVMDTARLLRGDKVIARMIASTKNIGKIVDGHCPALPLSDETRYLRMSGAKTDHESTSVTEILRKHGKGLWIHLRRTSFGREYPYASIFKKTRGERLMLATDGCASPVDIIKDGHISAFVRELISDNVSPLDAMAAATITPARCYGLDANIGSIKAGKKADFIIAPDIKDFKSVRTFVNGVDVTDVRSERFSFPAYALTTIKAKIPTLEQIAIRAPRKIKGRSRVMVNVIGLRKNSLLTEKKIALLKNSGGVIHPAVSRDILKAVVLQRYNGSGRPRAGFVQGFGLKAGAFGGSIGQDCQHICVIGCNDADICVVIDAIIKAQGGIFFAKDRKIVAGLRLPIGGIMTDGRPEKTAARLEALEQELRHNGVKAASPYLTLSLQITLAAIPELKMTNRGLLDVRSGKFIDVVRERRSRRN